MLKLKKNGNITTEKGKSTNTALFFLNDAIVLEDGFTLRSFFKMVDKHKEFQLLNVYFKDFLDEYMACKVRGCTCHDIKYIEVYKEIDNSVYDDMEDFTESIVVHGTGNKDCYAIEYTELNELLDIPIKIAQLKYIKCFLTEKHKKSEIKQYDTPLSLYDFVTGLILELSFFGTPDNRRKQCKVLKERIAEIPNE